MELYDIEVHIEKSSIRYEYTIMVTASTRNSFNYCKELDPNNVFVIDVSNRNRKIGFKFSLGYEDLIKLDFDGMMYTVKKHIPPEFKKYEYEILRKFLEREPFTDLLLGIRDCRRLKI